ncbi:hypothetical protein DCAR_0934167 [Daucus carota subsp. sativus]|uniref:Uncharacterized protein n=1 Tax=Daucus carota subsp. sativus TaxID=79200 RepID=A0A175YGU6_DAUCS|nr:hypothetical protein DCAR_0934167 [Daucus carota subsp. sativus]
MSRFCKAKILILKLQKSRQKPFVCPAAQEGCAFEEEELRELKLEWHKELLSKMKEQKASIEALKDDNDISALKQPLWKFW